MNILDKIVAYKRQEVEQRKALTKIEDLEAMPLFCRTPLVVRDWMVNPDKSGIIAEHKRKSPSKGIINNQVTVEEVTTGYCAAGVSAISVLTDGPSFDGLEEHLTRARAAVDCPLLRKDFTVDEYQLYEAKAIGADMILLIAAILEPEHTQALGKKARELGLSILLEVHDENELKQHCNDYVDLLGVNNRNLKTFDVSIETSIVLSKQMSADFVKVSESGISNIENILRLKEYGFQGFLIGENFMKTDNPGEACKNFIEELKKEQAHV